MSNIFWKNLLKCLPASTTTTATSPHPLNIQQEHTHLLQSSTTTTTATAKPSTTASSIIINNFSNSFYDLSSASTSKSLSSFSSSDSDSDTDSPLDFAAIFASQRFFFSSPGRSNSIIESPETIPESESQTEVIPLTGGVAVKKYSPDPYSDFKHSMQEMIEARKLSDVKADWDYLHELLSCYLSLNPKHTHKFIISAFADIIICLLSSSSSESDTLQKPEGRRRHNISHWLV
ncbi:transcription repressor OFP12 [Jatropha curcas]|uniref:transcription repressor OFP12 n=1 Tax=Jatropha curcas TaxID=180498 RepID=UPI0005FABBA2|nr:transcription repressor OFP12 [Jatropha curcas]